MSAWDVVDYCGIAVWLVWMLWFWRTLAKTFLNPRYPSQLGVKAAVPVILAALALAAVSGLLLMAQGG